jgi:ankyrin repeat protein
MREIIANLEKLTDAVEKLSYIECHSLLQAQCFNLPEKASPSFRLVYEAIVGSDDKDAKTPFKNEVFALLSNKTQERLMTAMRLLGYTLSSAGECAGFAVKASQAISTNGIKAYDDRIKKIYEMTDEQLLKIGRTPLTSDEVEILAFFQDIRINQEPNKFPDIFEKEMGTQCASITATFTQPISLDGKKLCRVSTVGAYEKNDFQLFIHGVRDILFANEEALPTSLTLRSANHQMVLTYDPSKKLWLIFNLSASITLKNENIVEAIVRYLYPIQEISDRPLIFESIIHSFSHLAVNQFQKFNQQYLSNNMSRILDMQDSLGASIEFTAARSGNLDHVDFLMKNGADIKKSSFQGLTPLLIAAHDGNLEIVRRLFRAGADLNHVNDAGYTALSFVVQNGFTEIFKFLIENGAKLPLRVGGNNEWNLLGFSAFHGRLEVVQYLLDRFHSGENIDEITCGTVGHTLFTAAAASGNIELVTFLEAKGAKIHFLNAYSDNALGLSAAYGHMKLVRYFIRESSDIDKVTGENNSTLLMCAAVSGNVGLMKFLVKKSPHLLNKADKNGWLPIHYASESRQLESLKYLIDIKADVNAKNKNGESPLHLATKKGDFILVKYLVENGANVNNKNEKWVTPLHLAAEYNYLATVKYLMVKNATIDAKNEEGMTALFLAAIKGNLMVVHSLLQNGAEINTTENDGRTALHIAVLCGRLDAAEYLIESGAEINMVDERGDCPLIAAARLNNFSAVLLLTSHEADANITTKTGHTALNFALMHHNLEMAKCLVLRGATFDADAVDADIFEYLSSFSSSKLAPMK